MLEKLSLSDEVENVIEWIKEYLSMSGAKGVVVGNSGGKDSATVIGLATKAIGRENVITVAMPCNSKKKDLDDAKLVAKTFGVKLITVDLTNTYLQLEKDINIELIEEAKINIKPRLRMTTLYGIAQTYGYLVIGTGNLCERMVGYTTKWGDSASDFNPIGDFTVEEVFEIGRIIGVPKEILEKAPSDGLGKLTDEEKMGVTYKQISEYIETGKTDKNAEKNILNKIKNSEHKRKEVPIYRVKR